MPKQKKKAEALQTSTAAKEEPPAANLPFLRKQRKGKRSAGQAGTEAKELDHIAVQASILKRLDGRLHFLEMR